MQDLEDQLGLTADGIITGTRRLIDQGRLSRVALSGSMAEGFALGGGDTLGLTSLTVVHPCDHQDDAAQVQRAAGSMAQRWVAMADDGLTLIEGSACAGEKALRVIRDSHARLAVGLQQNSHSD